MQLSFVASTSVDISGRLSFARWLKPTLRGDRAGFRPCPSSGVHSCHDAPGFGGKAIVGSVKRSVTHHRKPWQGCVSPCFTPPASPPADRVRTAYREADASRSPKPILRFGERPVSAGRYIKLRLIGYDPQTGKLTHPARQNRFCDSASGRCQPDGTSSSG